MSTPVMCMLQWRLQGQSSLPRFKLFCRCRRRTSSLRRSRTRRRKKRRSEVLQLESRANTRR
jgi:hypothetical protein